MGKGLTEKAFAALQEQKEMADRVLGVYDMLADISSYEDRDLTDDENMNYLCKKIDEVSTELHPLLVEENKHLIGGVADLYLRLVGKLDTLCKYYCDKKQKEENSKKKSKSVKQNKMLKKRR